MSTEYGKEATNGDRKPLTSRKIFKETKHNVMSLRQDAAPVAGDGSLAALPSMDRASDGEERVVVKSSGGRAVREIDSGFHPRPLRRKKYSRNTSTVSITPRLTGVTATRFMAIRDHLGWKGPAYDAGSGRHAGATLARALIEMSLSHVAEETTRHTGLEPEDEGYFQAFIAMAEEIVGRPVDTLAPEEYDLSEG